MTLSVVFQFSQIIAGTYISIFLIYYLILNFDKIKEILLEFQNNLINKLIGKSNSERKDLINFSILSVIIFFLIDFIFTKISVKNRFVKNHYP